MRNANKFNAGVDAATERARDRSQADPVNTFIVARSPMGRFAVVTSKTYRDGYGTGAFRKGCLHSCWRAGEQIAPEKLSLPA